LQRPATSPLTIIYTFTGGNGGAFPLATPVEDRSGRIIGTTQVGGVYALTPFNGGWSESALSPLVTNPVVLDKAGDIFGTTLDGGAYGYGSVVELAPSASGYTETILHSFAQDGIDGDNPASPLLLAKDGAIFGTTLSGGTYEAGTVFELTPGRDGYTESILYDFPSKAPPGPPAFASGLVEDASGALYGTTHQGESGNTCSLCGTVFKLTPTGNGYVESDLHVFGGGNDGANPEGAPVIGASGKLYGTTEDGGNTACTAGPEPGCGTVYALTPSAGSYSESIVHAFASGNDGATPVAGLTAGKHGVLYGTTSFGGAHYGGTVFALTQLGSGYAERVLVEFSSNGPAYEPGSGLLEARNGRLYGTTVGGGGTCGGDPCGTVFEVRPKL
jgi:hypothetical protein